MDKKTIEAIALSIRALTMDAVQKANSGHPGLPMGLAEVGALLYSTILKYNPQNPLWINRDRLVLSAGHGSMLLYSILHLAGFAVSLDDIKNFRQLGSITPGHPEYGLTPGVDTTTGPLGQGLANAVGMAIAEQLLAARFNTPQYKIIDHFTFAITSDGCMMEGVTSEASSLAGHLGLGKLIVFYDSNHITIEGSTDLAFSEDVAKRYEAYGWHVQKSSAYDTDNILTQVERAKADTARPSLIVLTSTIAKGAATMENDHNAHGAPLGGEEIKATRAKLGIPLDQDFYIHPDVPRYFQDCQKSLKTQYQLWDRLFTEWSQQNPQLRALWDRYFEEPILKIEDLPEFKVGEKMATRVSGGKVINAVAQALPNLVGGSADLAPSNKTYLNGMGDIKKHDFTGRNFHFGIREHGMGSVVNGIVLHGGLIPFCATFFVFADYMRPPIRLAALMKQRVIYVFTHDSFYVGEDGPTHQPVEHLASLRCIPNLLVLRPADAQETNLAWLMAIGNKSGPTAIALTRQDLEVFEKADKNWLETARRGAYLVKAAKQGPRLVIMATGSEVTLALDALKILNRDDIQVVSVVNRELFLKQDKNFREKLLPQAASKMVIEAGTSFGWEGLLGESGSGLFVDTFGESGPYKKVAAHFGFTVDKVVEKIKTVLE